MTLPHLMPCCNTTYNFALGIPSALLAFRPRSLLRTSSYEKKWPSQTNHLCKTDDDEGVLVVPEVYCEHTNIVGGEEYDRGELNAMVRKRDALIFFSK